MTKKEKLINLTDEKNKKELTKQEKFILSLEEKARKGKNKEKNKKSYSKFKQEKKEDEIEKSFRMISKITPQKRKKRYNIFIDGDFAFGVDEEV
ncbi:MAG: hypothetical protein L0I93_05270 [Atopostipes suicloacalis]|nr:hypothetical protein [Atopostipes suicloacalis]